MRTMVSSKKGISAHQLHRVLEGQYKSAWLLSHRIREAMCAGDLAPFAQATRGAIGYAGVRTAVRVVIRRGYSSSTQVAAFSNHAIMMARGCSVYRHKLVEKSE